jgi:hypothetical protein
MRKREGKNEAARRKNSTGKGKGSRDAADDATMLKLGFLGFHNAVLHANLNRAWETVCGQSTLHDRLQHFMLQREAREGDHGSDADSNEACNSDGGMSAHSRASRAASVHSRVSKRSAKSSVSRGSIASKASGKLSRRATTNASHKHCSGKVKQPKAQRHMSSHHIGGDDEGNDTANFTKQRSISMVSADSRAVRRDSLTVPTK